MDFRRIDPRSLSMNPFSLIAEEWMLVTAGSPGDWNTMTASWGGFGHLWNRDVAFVFVRPTRHTYGFMEREARFSLSFFGPGMRKALALCGSLSGRDVDKAQAAGITPRVFDAAEAAPGDPAGPGGSPTPSGLGGPGGPGGAGGADSAGVVAFEEARLVLALRKLHAQDLDPACFVDPSINGHYEALDWHRLYVGAVEAAWSRD